MSKRTISQTELEESGVFESDSGESEYESTRHNNSEFKDVENQVVRYIMSRELKSQVIRREHITQLYSNRRINYDELMSRVKQTLMEVYGLTLVFMSPKEGDKKNKSGQSSGRQPLVLTNCLSPEGRSVLQEIWLGDSDVAIPNNRNTGDNHYFLPKYNKTSSLGSNIDMVKTGVTLLIMTLLIISENHMSEHELVKGLKRFGLSDDPNTKNSSFNASLPELINELVKREYLEKEVQKDSNNVDNVDYKLGRRSLVEFTPLSVFAYIKTVYGDSFDIDTEKKALTTIQKAYGISLDVAPAAIPEEAATQDLTDNDPNLVNEQEVRSSS
mmetsp:Transcript_7795/g.9830  ORF Transcript_7795/g.9830 Transcript_7795/m.9830 type:complete len:328 (-) Transcript_7795:289-1272(-)